MGFSFEFGLVSFVPSCPPTWTIFKSMFLERGAGMDSIIPKVGLFVMATSFYLAPLTTFMCLGKITALVAMKALQVKNKKK
jgi:hypothetical protein